MKQVAVGLLIKDSLILIAQRKVDDNLSGKWEFPGGKIEQDETPEECLVREFQEEFNISIAVDAYFTSSIYHYDFGTIELLAYWGRWKHGVPKLLVHDSLRWVSISALKDFEFAPADVPIVNKLINRNVL